MQADHRGMRVPGPNGEERRAADELQRVSEDRIRDLTDRLHKQGNRVSSIEGQMLADRMVGDERYRQVEANTVGVRGELSSLTALVTQQSAAMNEVSQGQKSILQTMVSDRQTVIATAAALAEADRARHARNAEPFLNANRVIVLALGVAALLAYLSRALPL